MALETRLSMSSIFPNSICGFLFSAAPGERGGILRLISGRGRRSGRDRSNDLRRQSEADVLRHHFNFFELGESLFAQELDRLLHQDLGCGCSGGKSDSFDSSKPLRLNGAEILYEVRGAAEIARDLNETVRVGAVI